MINLEKREVETNADMYSIFLETNPLTKRSRLDVATVVQNPR